MKGRRFTSMWMLGAFIAGSLLRWRHHPLASNGIWIAGLIVGISGALFPASMQWFQRGWMRLTKLLNDLIARILIFLIFVLVLTPVAAIFRLFRRDELKLRRPKTETYWLPHDKMTDPESYRHLY